MSTGSSAPVASTVIILIHMEVRTPSLRRRTVEELIPTLLLRPEVPAYPERPERRRQKQPTIRHAA